MRWHRLWSCICSPMRVVSVAGKRAPFLLLPGAAPTERGRAAARRTLSKQPARSLPDLPSEAEQWLPNFGPAVATRGVPTLVGAARGCERRCGASSAILLRRPARSGRPKAVSAGRSGAEESPLANILANLCGKGGGAQVRRRSRVGKALRKPLGFLLGWGVESSFTGERARTGERALTLPNQNAIL